MSQENEILLMLKRIEENQETSLQMQQEHLDLARAQLAGGLSDRPLGHSPAARAI